jgi:hypothetical protein
MRSLRKTDAGSPTQQKCTHLSRVKSTHHEHDPEEMTPQSLTSAMPPEPHQQHVALNKNELNLS